MEDLPSILLTSIKVQMSETSPQLKKLSHHSPPSRAGRQDPSGVGTSRSRAVASGDGSAQPVTEGAASLVWALISATLVGHPVGQCSAPHPPGVPRTGSGACQPPCNLEPCVKSPFPD